MLLGLLACGVAAGGRDGETVYTAECATCHDSGASRMPAFAMIKDLEPGRIVASLQTGAMRVVGNFNLDGLERLAN